MIDRLHRVPDRTWTLAILLLAFGLRVYHLGNQSLWFDESFTWWVGAVLPSAELWPSLLPFGAYTPLFYLLMRGVAAIGQSEYVLRFPAVFFGVLLIPVVDRIGRRVGGVTVGRLAALLVAINPFSIWYSQDARMYTMASFFVLVAMDGFMRAIDGRGWRRSIVGAGAAYFTHYVTLFVVYIQLVWWLPRFRRQLPAFRRWFGSHWLAVLPLAPWLALYFSQPVRGLAITWIPAPSLLAPLLTLWNFTSGDIDTWTPIVVGIALIIAGVAVIGALQPLRWRSLLIGWLILPLISSYLLSFRVPTYVDRYFAFSQFALIVMLAIGLTSMPNKLVAIAAGVAIGGLMLVNTLRLHTDPIFVKEDWRSAAAIVNRQIQSGDRLGIEDNEGLLAWIYYYRGEVAPVPILIDRKPDALDRLSAGVDRLWVVYRSQIESNHRFAKSLSFDVFTQTDRVTQQWLGANCRPPLSEWKFSGVTVLLCPGR